MVHGGCYVVVCAPWSIPARTLPKRQLLHPPSLQGNHDSVACNSGFANLQPGPPATAVVVTRGDGWVIASSGTPALFDDASNLARQAIGAADRIGKCLADDNSQGFRGWLAIGGQSGTKPNPPPQFLDDWQFCNDPMPRPGASLKPWTISRNVLSLWDRSRSTHYSRCCIAART